MAALPFTPTRVMFFTGKGGVGKTSLACATAVSLADSGRRVLLVSTDPASNLDEVLGVRLSTRPTGVPGVPRLSALNIDPDTAADEYRERVVGPYRALLPASAVARIEEQLSGACTMEIAAFDEFTSLLGDAKTTADFDHVLFDTAPTGHTLRLLKLPAAWTGFIDTNTTGTSCLGPLAGLQGRIGLYRESLAALANAAVTTVVLVTRPETSALAEAARTSVELAELGVTHQRLVVNGVFTARDGRDGVARALDARGQGCAAGRAGTARSTSQDRRAPAAVGAPGHRRPPPRLHGGCGDRSPARRRNAPGSVRVAGFDRRPRGRRRARRTRGRAHDGQGRSGQDDDGGGDRHRAGFTRSRRPAEHDRPGGARGRCRRRRHSAPSGDPHRSCRRDEGVQRRGHGGGCSNPRCPRSGSARGGSPLAVHRGDRGVPRIRPGGRGGGTRFRRPGHRAHGAHAPAARCGRGVPP